MRRRERNPILSPLSSSTLHHPSSHKESSNPLDLYSKAFDFPSIAERNNKAELLTAIHDLQEEYDSKISHENQSFEENSITNDSVTTIDSSNRNLTSIRRILLKIGKALSENKDAFHYSRGKEFTLSVTEAMEYFVNSLHIPLSPSEIHALSQRFAVSDARWNIDMSKCCCRSSAIRFL